MNRFFCLIMLFAISLNCHAKIHYDSVSKITLNGIDMTKPVAPTKIDKIFGVAKRKKLDFNECTGLYTMTLSYPKKNIAFTNVEEQLFLLKKNTGTFFVEISWDSMHKFNEI